MPQYNGVWTLQAQSQALTNQQWVTDPNFKNTTLLLQADNAANSAQNNTFLDSSSNAFAITRNGNTTQGSFTPFSQAPGYWGNYFSSAYLQTSSAVITSTTTTFTVEAWIYMTQLPTTGGSPNVPCLIGDFQPTGTSNYWSFGPMSTGLLQLFWYDGTNKSATGNTVMAPNTWNHIAISVNANAISMYVNGVQQTITGNSTLTNRSGSLSYTTIGQYNTSTGIYYGYVSNMSVLSGTAKYSASFTPTTTPLSTSTANQTLLTCWDNRLVDSNTATTAKTLTVSATSVQAFGPFASQYQWTAPVIGGSGYYGASTDYLTTPCATNNSAFGTADFTVEVWVYPTASATYITPASSNYSNGTGAGNWAFYFGVGSATTVYFNGGTANSGSNHASSTTTTIPLNAWTQVVYSRVSSVARFFINGVQLGTTVSDTNNYSSTTGTLYFGRMADGTNTVTGYLSDVRIIKGTGYTSYTLPTAPLTAITNTGLLLSCTNAGIYDGTMKNDLQTVSTAQVATSPVKYGSGSMSFNGSSTSLTFADTSKYNLFNLGTGDFTVEFWFYLNNTTTGIVFARTVSGTNNFLIGVGANSTDKLYFTATASGSGTQIFSSGTPSVGVWQHAAIVRQNGYVTVYLNGVGGTPTSNTTNLDLTYVPTIGAYSHSFSNAFNGYLDDFRFTKGLARYTANFIPPQVALPRQ
jgi:hypothetical protein